MLKRPLTSVESTHWVRNPPPHAHSAFGTPASIPKLHCRHFQRPTPPTPASPIVRLNPDSRNRFVRTQVCADLCSVAI
jgi:hypothetical protein